MNLPHEVWLEVLSHLDYLGLKKCMCLSKSFHTLTSHALFDKTLFRSRAVVPADGAITPNEVHLHPAFEYMSFGCGTKIEDVCFWPGDKKLPLTESSAAKEHATDPPVSKLRLQVHRWAPIEVKNKHGVHVLQVMQALCRFFAKGHHRESMGDHTVWNGWDQTVLDDKSRLLLRAIWFDS